jgi:hypothetical protein
LIEQATLQLAHTDQTALPQNAVSAYRQANELMNAAQRAMADHDYVAASSLAEKASALTGQFSPQK